MSGWLASANSPVKTCSGQTRRGALTGGLIATAARIVDEDRNVSEGRGVYLIVTLGNVTRYEDINLFQ